MSPVRRLALLCGVAALVGGALLMRLPGVQGASHASTVLLNQNHNCNFCHSLHNAPGQSLTNNAVVQDLCLSCHGPAGTAPRKAAIHTNKTGSLYPAFSYTCQDCHDTHSNPLNAGGAPGDTNIKLVLANISVPSGAGGGTPSVVFEAVTGANAFADDAAPYDGVCEVCHYQNTHHRFDGEAPEEPHNNAAQCTSCHPHTDNFAPTGGSCLDCHVDPQDNGDGNPPGGRRAIVAEFGWGSHHVQGTLDDADCEKCHDQTGHMDGTIRLNGDLTTSIAVTDPETNASERAAIEPFCLSCHDADGYSGTPPFSGGQTPPDIGVTAWNASSHNSNDTQNITCFDCHGSHGSQKIKLLQPVAVAPTGNADEEEGFCWSCHDADGPSLIDIKSLFTGNPVNWVDLAAGEFNNLNLNNRHDIEDTEQAQSGAKLECTSCHNPHAATSALPVIADPDPSDGRVPTNANYVVGADFYTHWCLDCHDGSFPSGVTGPTTQLQDVFAASTGRRADGMGEGSGRATLKAGYGYVDDMFVQCMSCHDPHASKNLFHLVETVLSTDGTTPVPTDGSGSYEVTQNSIVDPATNGWQWCNTCHTGSMGNQQDNCSSCHYHSTRW